jgi:hypothetical protein
MMKTRIAWEKQSSTHAKRWTISWDRQSSAHAKRRAQRTWPLVS